MLLQSCPDYIQAIGNYVPPLTLLGLFAIPLGAIAGKRLVTWLGDPKIGYVVARIRNGILAVTIVLTVILLLVTGWLVSTTPSSCYRWFFFL